MEMYWFIIFQWSIKVFYFSLTGNRRQGAAVIEFRHDDEVHGFETRSSIKNL